MTTTNGGPTIADCDRQNRIAGGWLLYYDDRLEELTLQVQDIQEASAASMNSAQCRNGSGISDPTARKALALATPELIQQENWLALIREVEAKLPDQYRIFLFWRRKYRYYRGRKGWIPLVQRKFAADMAKIAGQDEEEVWRSERTLGVYWDKMVDYTVRLAIKRGLLT